MNNSEPAKRQDSSPAFIAHRGYAAAYPENTLLALNEAFKAGAEHVEFDIQFTVDGIPVLLHDNLLKRTTGHDGDILDLTYNELRQYQACETARFGSAFANTGIGIPSLSDAVYLLKNWPQSHAFVEIKEESIKKFGIEKIIKTMIEVIQPALSQCTLISYDLLAVRCARAMGAESIGWVLTEWNKESLSTATELAPDYLFCNHKKVPMDETLLWPGPWKWVLFEVVHPEVASELHHMGAAFIETMDVGQLIHHSVGSQEVNSDKRSV